MKVKTYNISIKGVEEDRQVILPLLSDDQYYHPPGISMSNQSPQVTNAGTKSRRRRKKGTKGGGEGGASEGIKKRKLTAEQLSFLEINFGSEHKLDSARKDKLAGEMELDPRQVAVWFQNRRARWRSKQLEHDYSILKTNHETLLLDKCCLEAKVCVLKEQLEEAEKEIRRLSAERPEIASDVRTQCSYISTEDTYDPSSFLGGFGGGLDEDGSLFFFTGYHDYYNNAMDWLNWNGL